MNIIKHSIILLITLLLISCAASNSGSPSKTIGNEIKPIETGYTRSAEFERNKISFLTYLQNQQIELAKLQLDKMEAQLSQMDYSQKVELSFYKASYLLNSGSIDAGLLELDNCLQLSPDHLQALFSKAYVGLNYKQSYNEAELYYDKILTLVEADSTNGSISYARISPFYYNFKKSYKSSSNNKPVEEQTYKFIRRDLNLKHFKKLILNQIYESSLKRKDYNKAIISLKQMSALDIFDLERNNKIADLYFKQKNYQQADLYYSEALSDGINKFDNYANRGTCRYHLTSYTSALSDFEKCLAINDNNQLINEQYQHYRNSKEVIDTEIKGNDGIIPNLRNKLTDVIYLKARSQDKLGRKDEAFDTLTALLKYNKSHAMAFYYRGFYYNDKKDPMRAVKDFRRALDRDPSLTGLYYEIAKNNDDFKLYDKAKTNYKLFLENDKKKGSKKHQQAEQCLKQLRTK